MNGLYDPNLTGTGSQPPHFDTLCGANTTAAPYRAYVVKAADGDGLRPRSRFSGHPFSRCDFPASPEHLPDLLRSRNRCSATTRTTGYSPTTPVASRSPQSIGPARWPRLGVKDIEDANGTNAAYSANPTNLAHFVVTVAPLNQSTAPVINLNVEIRYWVKFYS